MNNKKNIPLILLKAIEKIAQANLDIIKPIKEANTHYVFQEVDKTSNNYFKIFVSGSTLIGNYDPKNFAYEYKPVDETSHKKKLTQGSADDVKIAFENWVKIIREINDIPSVYDDNFLNYYSDFYFKEYEIFEDDANVHPFSPEQQEYIELYLISLTKSINETEDKTIVNSRNELLLEINEINNSLSLTTKNQVMKKITRILGKLYTISKPLASEIIKETGKQLIKKLIELGIQYGPKLLEMYNNNQK